MKYVIDRIEGTIAVCEGEDGKMVEITKTRLPNGAREGSAILIDDDGKISLADNTVMEKRIAEKMKAIWK
jgi:hypothetical protein